MKKKKKKKNLVMVGAVLVAHTCSILITFLRIYKDPK